MADSVIIANGISRIFKTPAGNFTALSNINLDVEKGCFAILKGRSGSGKTTLMNILSGLDNPTEGEVIINGQNLTHMSEKEKENLRRSELGFVFQAVSLIPSLNVYQNVEFSLRMAGKKIDKAASERIKECIKLVGLSARADHMSAELSGGEQQRVAIARSIVHKPAILFADEPTAELDSVMAVRMVTLFKEMAHKEGITVIMTTHDVGLMDAADTIIELENGVRINA